MEKQPADPIKGPYEEGRGPGQWTTGEAAAAPTPAGAAGEPIIGGTGEREAAISFDTQARPLGQVEGVPGEARTLGEPSRTWMRRVMAVEDLGDVESRREQAGPARIAGILTGVLAGGTLGVLVGAGIGSGLGFLAGMLVGRARGESAGLAKGIEMGRLEAASAAAEPRAWRRLWRRA